MSDERPNLSLLRASDIAQHSQTFSHPWNPRSEISGAMLGRMTGLKRTGVNFARIAPGKESFVYHSHASEEEWIYILSGHATARIDGQEYPVGPGDFMGFPTPSVAHHLVNTGKEDLIYLMGGESREMEVSDFPDLGRRMVRRGAQIEVYDIKDGKPLAPGG
ncbi:MAG TPA: cupin domain-containing protein [Steroidobacteraceae bacterium]|nr:cupin domain-containing protein [Steroidobacteraceae bacterium]